MTIARLIEDPRSEAQQAADDAMLDSFLDHCATRRRRKDMHPAVWRTARLCSVALAALDQLHPLVIPKGDTFQRRSQHWRRARRKALAFDAKIIAALKRDSILL